MKEAKILYIELPVHDAIKREVVESAIQYLYRPYLRVIIGQRGCCCPTFKSEATTHSPIATCGASLPIKVDEAMLGSREL